MNILLASREFPGINPSGGIGVYAQSWARAMAQDGHTVRVITMAAEGPAPQVEAPYQFEFVQADPRFKEFAWGYSYALYQKIRSLEKQAHWDLVEFPDYLAEGYFTVKAKRVLGEFAGTVLRVHGHMSLEVCDRINQEIPDGGRRRIYLAERYSMRYCDVLSAPSEDLAREYEDQSQRPVAVTRHPLPVFPGATSQASLAGGPPRVLYAGRLEYRKGVDLLVDACIALWQEGLEFELQLAGQDTLYRSRSFRAHLESRIPPAVRNKVSFLGAVGRDALQNFYAGARVVVFPSRFENWPNVCLEAMSQGLPVIASKWGGMREMLEGGAGVLINPEHQPSFSLALAEILQDPALAASLGQEAKERVTALAAAPGEILAALQDMAPNSFETGRESPLSLTVIVQDGPDQEARGQVLRSLLESPAVSEILLAQAGPAVPDFGPLPPRVRVVAGVPEFTSAWRESAGDLVAFVADSEQWDPDFLSQAARALARNPELSAVYPMASIGQEPFWEAPEDLGRSRALVPEQCYARPVVRRRALADSLWEDRPDPALWPQWQILIYLARIGLQAELLPTLGVYIPQADAPWRTAAVKALWQEHSGLLGESGLDVLVDQWERTREAQLDPAAAGIFRQAARRLPGWIKRPVKRLAQRAAKGGGEQ